MSGIGIVLGSCVGVLIVLQKDGRLHAHPTRTLAIQLRALDQ
jgi:hypothetical protein